MTIAGLPGIYWPDECPFCGSADNVVVDFGIEEGNDIWGCLGCDGKRRGQAPWCIWDYEGRILQWPSAPLGFLIADLGEATE